jgi:hypothetical protein
MSKISYSPTEQALLEILQVQVSLDTHALTDAYYDGRDRPWHAETVIRSAMSELIKKVQANGENFEIQRIKPAGRKPVVYSVFQNHQVRA